MKSWFLKFSCSAKVMMVLTEKYLTFFLAVKSKREASLLLLSMSLHVLYMHSDIFWESIVVISHSRHAAVQSIHPDILVHSLPMITVVFLLHFHICLSELKTLFHTNHTERYGNFICKYICTFSIGILLYLGNH